jgi:hypothetical protein
VCTHWLENCDIRGVLWESSDSRTTAYWQGISVAARLGARLLFPSEIINNFSYGISFTDEVK